MDLKLYDTLSREKRVFKPIDPANVRMYVCGPTVYDFAHIGNARPVIVFDVLFRLLRHIYGADHVTYVRNITDVDDKINARAAEEYPDLPLNEAIRKVTEATEAQFQADVNALGCLPPTHQPRATEFVLPRSDGRTDMKSLIQKLLDRGNAYVAEGTEGKEVLFDVSSMLDYGALSGQRPEAMQPAADTDVEGHKRDPRDFALWKAAKPGEPAWDTPWGRGRPGWHLECSAMAGKYLGSSFDIHGGGLDLVFPHHENEIAQSKAAGDEFARYWLHNGWVTTAGEKMSKSLGNSLLVSAIVRRVRPVELRYFLAAPHYRSMVEFSDEALAEAATAYGRVETFLRHAADLLGELDAGSVPAAFAAAMDDDLSTPAAIAAVHNAVREGNSALAAGEKETVAARAGEVRAMLGVLGLDPTVAPWADTGQADLTGVVDRLVQVVLTQRQAARERKDFAAADGIRDGLRAAGILVEDTSSGPRWTVATPLTGNP